jgi:hypothetical protein
MSQQEGHRGGLLFLLVAKIHSTERRVQLAKLFASKKMVRPNSETKKSIGQKMAIFGWPFFIPI